MRNRVSRIMDARHSTRFWQTQPGFSTSSERNSDEATLSHFQHVASSGARVEGSFRVVDLLVIDSDSALDHEAASLVVTGRQSQRRDEFHQGNGFSRLGQLAFLDVSRYLAITEDLTKLCRCSFRRILIVEVADDGFRQIR